MGNIKPRRWRWWINAEEFCTSLVSEYALLEGPVHGRAELTALARTLKRIHGWCITALHVPCFSCICGLQW
jgi:hypothetical protein